MGSKTYVRGCSSHGRPLALHARGTGIDTLHLHITLCLLQNVKTALATTVCAAQPLARLGISAHANIFHLITHKPSRCHKQRLVVSEAKASGA